MSKNKKISENVIQHTFLKWLVTIMSIIMITGFLFLITILGLKIYGIDSPKKISTNTLNKTINLPVGTIENLEINSGQLVVVVRLDKKSIKVVVINLANGDLVNEYTIKQNEN